MAIQIQEFTTMAKKSGKKKKKPIGRIVLRTGEALVEAEPAWSAAEPEVVIGELDGPVGYAIANLLGDQTKGHSRVFAILNCDVQVRPVTLMVSKVTVDSTKYTNILMGTVQAAIANGVLDAVRAGDIPKEKANDLGIIISVWLDPSVVTEQIDFNILFETNRAATAQAIHKAMNNEPGIDWLLENQSQITHCFHQMALDGK
jgi:5,6,7,8-tetrahydromethanopterin hydro-lyase